MNQPQDWPAWVGAALESHPVARLGTSGPDGTVRLVPVCFALTGGMLVSAVDHKPKRTGQLRRLDDMRATGRATMLVDHYDDDWAQLWWVRVSGTAHVFDDRSAERRRAIDALCAKYRQYAERPPTGTVWALAPDTVRWWRSTG